jgi:GGDEF domain-containing protein
VAQRIIKSAEDWNAEGHMPGFQLTLSIGLAEMTEGKTLDHVLNEADQNMYLVKGPGKNHGKSPV